MSKVGRPKTPTALKLLEGTFREDRDGGAIIAPPGNPIKPEWLGEIASKVWDERIAAFSQVPGLLSEIDGPSLALYCHAWQVFHDAKAEIERRGIVAISEKGSEYQHPAVGIQNKAIEIIGRIGAKFGMTPSDRASLRPTTKTTDDEISELIA